MPGVYSHNRMCDAEHWVGEVAMNDFEELVLVDDIMDTPVIETYEVAIENFWPLFIEDMET